MPKTQISIRISDDGRARLAWLCEKMNDTQTGVIEKALIELEHKIQTENFVTHALGAMDPGVGYASVFRALLYDEGPEG